MSDNTEAHFNQKLHERLLFLLYQKEFRNTSLEILNQYLEEDSMKRYQIEFGHVPVVIVTKILQKKEELDSIMNDNLSNWKIDRIMLLDKIILRIGIYELLFEPSMKSGIIIDRAIRLAKTYGGMPSGKFVNGILGSVYRKYRSEKDDSPNITEDP